MVHGRTTYSSYEKADPNGEQIDQFYHNFFTCLQRAVTFGPRGGKTHRAQGRFLVMRNSAPLSYHTAPGTELTYPLLDVTNVSTTWKGGCQVVVYSLQQRTPFIALCCTNIQLISHRRRLILTYNNCMNYTIPCFHPSKESTCIGTELRKNAGRKTGDQTKVHQCSDH